MYQYSEFMFIEHESDHCQIKKLVVSPAINQVIHPPYYRSPYCSTSISKGVHRLCHDKVLRVLRLMMESAGFEDVTE